MAMLRLALAHSTGTRLRCLTLPLSPASRSGPSRVPSEKNFSMVERTEGLVTPSSVLNTTWPTKPVLELAPWALSRSTAA